MGRGAVAPSKGEAWAHPGLGVQGNRWAGDPRGTAEALKNGMEVGWELGMLEPSALISWVSSSKSSSSPVAPDSATPGL